MGFPKKILKLIRWLVIGLIAVLIIISGVIYFGAQDYLNKNLSDYVFEKTGGLYKFGFDRIDLHFAQKSMVISDIDLSHDNKIAGEIQSEYSEKVFYSFSSPEVRVEHVNLRDMLFRKKLHIRKISVVNPRFRLTGPELFGNDSAQVFRYALEQAQSLFKNHIHEIKADEIEFVNASYQFFNFIGDTSRVTNARRVSVGISGFRTDTLLLQNFKQPFETEDIFVRMSGFKNEMSDSIHMLEIDSLEYSLKRTELNAFDTHLYAELATNEKSLYDVRIPELIMRSKNLTGLNWADTLDISFLELENPEISFIPRQKSKRINIEDINKFDLYDLVRNEFSVIRVDSFNLKNAGLKIYKSPDADTYQQNFESINIRLLNFRVDSLTRSQKNKLLYADDIEMKISNYNLNLEDNLHRFSADSIYVSTFIDSLSVSGIRVKPLESLTKQPPVQLDIGCKNIILDQVDLKEVYHERVLNSSLVEVVNPNVSVSNYPNIPKENNQSGLLFDLVSAYLKGIYANVIYVDGGKLNYRNFTGGNLSDLYETGFNFFLTGFSLDSATQARSDKFFYASDFDLNFSDYRMQLEDNLHRLDVKNIHILNTESKVEIDSLHLYPMVSGDKEGVLRSYKRSELYNIFIPKITLFNTGLHKAFFRKELNISQFTIENPEITYENFAMLKSKENKLEFSELYELIFNYIQDISIGSVAVPAGEVTWINHSRKGKTITLDNKFSTKLEGFRLNPEEVGKQKLLFSQQIRFTLNDPLFKLSDNVHYLKAGKIDFSTIDNSIQISNALLYPDITAPEYLTKPIRFQLALPELEFTGTDLVKAWYSKIIQVDNIRLSNPKFEIYSQKERAKTFDLKKFTIPFPSFLKSLHVNRLNLENGEVITYRSEGIRHSQSSRFTLNLDSEDIRVLPTDGEPFNRVESGNIHTRISDFQLVFEDKSHEARLDEMDFNKNEKTITLKNFELNPSRFGQPDNTVHIKAPKVSLSGFDIDKAYEQNEYTFNKIEFQSPDIKIKLKDTIKSGGLEKFNNLNYYDYLEPYLNTLSVNEFWFTGASIDLNSSKTKLQQENINIKIKGIDIKPGKPKPGLLNSDGFEFSTFNYNRAPKDGFYKYTIDTIRYSSISNIAELRSVKINPKFSRGIFAKKKEYEVDVVDATISSAVLHGFNFDKWMDEKIIAGNKLTIGKSELNIFRDKRYPFNKNQRPQWPQQLISNISRPFHIDSVQLLSTNINYAELTENSPQPVTVHFSDITAKTGEITNMPEQQENNRKELNLIASGSVEKNARINLEVNFVNGSKRFLHHVKGNLTPVAMKTFNSIVEGNTLLTVEDGYINRLDFDFMANDSLASGELYFGYDDLKIGVFDYRKGDTIRSGFSSFMANKFMVHSKNPRGKSLEAQAIRYKRDPGRSILNYWWKAIFNSSKIILGIEKEKENKK